MASPIATEGTTVPRLGRMSRSATRQWTNAQVTAIAFAL